MQKRFTLLLTAIAIMAVNVAFAQSWGFSNPGNWAGDISIADDGSVWAIGYGGEDPDLMDVYPNYVVKTDANGIKIFGTSIMLAAFPYTIGQSVMPTDDGGAIVYCAGSYATPALCKIDAAGSIVWQTGALSGDGYIYSGKAVQLNDGRIVIAGLVDFEHKFVVTDASGTVLSEFSVAPDTTGGWAWSYFDYKEAGLIATPDGGFAYACGNYGNRILMKFDSDLNNEWTGYYTWGEYWEYGLQNGLSLTDDGGYLFASSSADYTGTYYGTLRKIDADGNMLWFTSVNHGWYGEEGSWAAELGSGDIAYFTQDGGEASTHAWILDGATGDEIGEEYIPVFYATGGLSLNGIEVWDAEPAADGGYYVAGRMFLEDFNQRMVVLKSNPDGSFNDCIFDCVWPGDANNDGYAMGDDLFEIGINYGATGSTRDDMTIDWSPKLSQMWYETDTLYWYIFNDLKYTDCNGSGEINDDDTTAVINNLGLDHPLNTARIGAGDIPLYLAPTTDFLSIGMNEIPIMLGDDLNTVDEIYGITFTISVEGENIDGYSLKINWDDNWMGTASESLSLSKNFGATKQVTGSFVRKTRVNTSGSGQIGTLQIVVVDNISGKVDFTDVEISFAEAKAVKLNREEIPLEASSITIASEDNSGVVTEESIINAAYPNPATETLFFNFNNTVAPELITISDITGATVLEVPASATATNGLDISKLATGNYIIRYTYSDKTTTEQLAIQ